MGLNYIVLIGEAISAPEKRHTIEGHPVASFNLSFNTSASDSSASGSLKITANKRLADQCVNEVHSGDLVMVEGKLYSKIIENRLGQKQKIPYILATNLQVVREKRPSLPESAPFEPLSEDNEDEIPF